MLAAVEFFLVTILVITWISGIALSSSVIIVYITEWKKNGQLSVCDRIFVFMALTNLLRQSSISFNVLTYVFWLPQLVMNRGYFIVCSVIFLYLIYDNTWHSAWLSMYYCAKLVDSPQCVFVLLRNRLSSSMTPLLIITSVASLLINLPYNWTMTIEFTHNNFSSTGQFTKHYNVPFAIMNIMLGCCLPFMVTLICIGISVGALLRHMWRIRHSASQFTSSPQLQGHLRATRTMILQVLLNLVLYILVIEMFSPPLGLIWEVLFWLALMSYPSIQIITIIMGNPKLKKSVHL